jgi:glycosyltransferase involved in cell wall biosynthesis
VRLGVAPRERFRVIPLGLDLSPYQSGPEPDRAEMRRELGIGDREVLVTYVGRIVPIKRLDLLIRAAGRAMTLGAPIRLAVVGDGETRTELETLAAQLEIGDRVRFLGYRRDLPRVFAATDIAAISSDNEGTPVSLIEAAAAGLPGVATDVGGVAEVVTPETGLLAPAGNEQALADALFRLAADPALRRRLGANARELALTSFSSERLISDIEALYTELLSGPS